MAAQVSFPGVYIEEFAPGAPIEGVGTSTAAFLGPCSNGPLNEPTKITNWDQFRATFGDSPLSGSYLWYAVRGFFENGGKICYVTRVSNADFDRLVLMDRSAGAGQATVRVWARKSGDNAAAPIQVAIAEAHAVSSATAVLFRPTATIVHGAGRAIKVTDPNDAAQFRSGNVITIEGSAEKVGIVRIEGDTIRLVSDLTAVYNAGTVRLANLRVGDKVFRVKNAEKLASGSVIELSQDPGGGNPPVTDVQVVKSVDVERISPVLTTYRVELRQGLVANFDLSPAANDVTVESQEFKLTVTQSGAAKDYDELTMDPAHPRYFANVINNDAAGKIYARSAEPPNTTAPPDDRPRDLVATALTGGANDNPNTLMAAHYKNALALLEAIDDVNMVAIPDRTDDDVQLAIIAHCTNIQDRFAILDSRRGAPLFGTDSVEVHRRSVETTRGYAALYYPWLQVSPAIGNGLVLVPPSGHVAGIYARIDNNRGVHKAPAGTEALVSGALGVERTMSDVDQGQLNLQGINVIRVFQAGGRPTVWGSRTTASDKNWQYVNVRRLFLFLEESIQEGIRWAVFEPHNPALWAKLKRSITAFLTQQWRDGAVFGNTPEEAFYVRIDETLNPDSQRALGRLYLEIGIRPSYPAEFIIVRIGIWQGGAEVAES